MDTLKTPKRCVVDTKLLAEVKTLLSLASNKYSWFSPPVCSDLIEDVAEIAQIPSPLPISASSVPQDFNDRKISLCTALIQRLAEQTYCLDEPSQVVDHTSSLDSAEAKPNIVTDVTPESTRPSTLPDMATNDSEPSPEATVDIDPGTAEEQCLLSDGEHAQSYYGDSGNEASQSDEAEDYRSLLLQQLEEAQLLDERAASSSENPTTGQCTEDVVSDEAELKPTAQSSPTITPNSGTNDDRSASATVELPVSPAEELTNVGPGTVDNADHRACSEDCSSVDCGSHSVMPPAASFADSEAEEDNRIDPSEGEEEEEGEVDDEDDSYKTVDSVPNSPTTAQTKQQHKRYLDGREFIESEAEEEGREANHRGHSDDSDDDYERDGFVVDEASDVSNYDESEEEVPASGSSSEEEQEERREKDKEKAEEQEVSRYEEAMQHARDRTGDNEHMLADSTPPMQTPVCDEEIVSTPKRNTSVQTSTAAPSTVSRRIRRIVISDDEDECEPRQASPAPHRNHAVEEKEGKEIQDKEIACEQPTTPLPRTLASPAVGALNEWTVRKRITMSARLSPHCRSPAIDECAKENMSPNIRAVAEGMPASPKPVHTPFEDCSNAEEVECNVPTEADSEDGECDDDLYELCDLSTPSPALHGTKPTSATPLPYRRPLGPASASVYTPFVPKSNIAKPSTAHYTPTLHVPPRTPIGKATDRNSSAAATSHPLYSNVAFFKKNREEIARKVYREINREALDGRLPEPDSDTLKWSVRMLTTAGFCRCRTVGGMRTITIELATKVVTTYEQLRNTLAHEMCHAADFLTGGGNPPHGPSWAAWARLVMRKFPELNITRCHSYKIPKKYYYDCVACGAAYGRHSKSIDVSKKGCGCGGRLVLRQKLKKDGTPLIHTPNAFSAFVKEHFAEEKKRHPGLQHRELMAILSAKYRSSKLAK